TRPRTSSTASWPPERWWTFSWRNPTSSRWSNASTKASSNSTGRRRNREKVFPPRGPRHPGNHRLPGVLRDQRGVVGDVLRGHLLHLERRVRGQPRRRGVHLAADEGLPADLAVHRRDDFGVQRVPHR